MLEKHLRLTVQRYLVDPIAESLSLYLTPIHLTLISGVLGLFVLPLSYLDFPICACLSLLLSGLFDMLDGTVARMTHTSSQWGAVLDIVMDRVVEMTVIFALFLMDPIGRGGASLAMMASILLCITSFLVVGIFSENDSQKSFHYSEGLMERAEAFIFFILMMLFPSLVIPLSFIFTSLVLWTAIIRLKEFRLHCFEINSHK